jgi:hypothetical protein
MKGRESLLPAPGLPLLYFGYAHLCLALALGALIVRPALPGSYFYHPQMVALVHLVTLGWISSSILGAFYIVAPLALRMAFRPGIADRIAWLAYAGGVSGMVTGVWMGEYRLMAWSAVPVTGTLLFVSVRAWWGLPRAPVPWPVKLHVALAFANVVGAAAFGIVIGVTRAHGGESWAPLPAAFAHAHLAAIGWAVMMVVGLSYRLIPMIVPAAMPTSASMAWSAVLLEIGVIGLTFSLLSQSAWTPFCGAVAVAGLAVFVAHVRGIVQHKMPPPAALHRPDWATWQTHVAFMWLLIATALGVVLTLPFARTATIPLQWTYGIAGLVGFLSQVVIGIQGRLLPLHGYYRMFQARGLKPPERSAHSLASPALAKATLFTWSIGVPLLAAGLASATSTLTATAAVLLMCGIVCNAAQGIRVSTANSRA